MKTLKNLPNKLRSLSALAVPQSDVRTSPQLPLDHFEPFPYTGPSYEEVLEKRRKYMPSGTMTFYKHPLLIVQGKGQYVFDHTGRRYVDMFASIVTMSVGHSHPRIVEVAKKQIDTLVHTSHMYVNDQVSQYAEELTQKFPDGLDTVFFTNSGSEANDLALRLARLYTGNYTMMALRNAYHGMSGLTTSLTSTRMWKHDLPESYGIERALVPDVYNGHFTGDDAIQRYLREFHEVVDMETSGRLAGFLCETIQGVGGVIDLSPEYLQEVFKTVRKAGGLCIVDEVQTGFARMGSHYWGFERKGLEPDIVVCAKGIANGLPLAAVVTRKEIADSMTSLMINTYGGNQLSSAVGREVLRVIDDENLQQNALETGQYLHKGLKELQDRHEIIGDVRGAGLMFGLEIVQERGSKEANDRACLNIFERTRELGLLIGRTRHIFRIKPTLVITKQDCDFALDVLDKAFTEEKQGLLNWF